MISLAMRVRLSALLVLGAVMSATSAQAQVTAEQGEEIAARLCSRCHAIGRKGDSPMGVAPPFRALSKRYPVENLAEAFAEGIVTGHPAMPRFVFEPREIDALLAYLQGLNEE